MRQRQPEIHEQAADAPASLFLRITGVVRLTGLGRSTIYRLIAAQTFPAPVKLAGRAVGWRRSDLDSWSAAQPVSTH